MPRSMSFSPATDRWWWTCASRATSLASRIGACTSASTLEQDLRLPARFASFTHGNAPRLKHIRPEKFAEDGFCSQPSDRTNDGHGCDEPECIVYVEFDGTW